MVVQAQFGHGSLFCDMGGTDLFCDLGELFEMLCKALVVKLVLSLLGKEQVTVIHFCICELNGNSKPRFSPRCLFNNGVGSAGEVAAMIS